MSTPPTQSLVNGEHGAPIRSEWCPPGVAADYAHVGGGAHVRDIQRGQLGERRVGAAPAFRGTDVRDLGGAASPSPQFRDKNRRDIGKSQSEWAAPKIEAPRSRARSPWAGGCLPPAAAAERCGAHGARRLRHTTHARHTSARSVRASDVGDGCIRVRVKIMGSQTM
jgi:hypothetical protein